MTEKKEYPLVTANVTKMLPVQTTIQNEIRMLGNLDGLTSEILLIYPENERPRAFEREFSKKEVASFNSNNQINSIYLSFRIYHSSFFNLGKKTIPTDVPLYLCVEINLASDDSLSRFKKCLTRYVSNFNVVFLRLKLKLNDQKSFQTQEIKLGKVRKVLDKLRCDFTFLLDMEIKKSFENLPTEFEKIVFEFSTKIEEKYESFAICMEHYSSYCSGFELANGFPWNSSFFGELKKDALTTVRVIISDKTDTYAYIDGTCCTIMLNRFSKLENLLRPCNSRWELCLETAKDEEELINLYDLKELLKEYKNLKSVLVNEIPITHHKFFASSYQMKDIKKLLEEEA